MITIVGVGLIIAFGLFTYWVYKYQSSRTPLVLAVFIMALSFIPSSAVFNHSLSENPNSNFLCKASCIHSVPEKEQREFLEMINALDEDQRKQEHCRLFKLTLNNL